MENAPKHVVIVPDGNRRWAVKNKLPQTQGHWEGSKTMEKVVEKANKLGIKYLTIWGGSVSNVTNRTPIEIKTLMQVYKTYLEKIANSKEIHENEARVRVLGRWGELFTEEAKKAAQKVIDNTKQYTKNNLTCLMAYTGTDEMVNAIQSICEDYKNNKISKVTSEIIKQHLWTKDLPPVDLVIRTGGEPHWSAGLMMFDVAEAHLYFTETLWPEFSTEEFEKAINEFAQRERRFGK